MYLLDTNIILEILLDQNQADKVEQFLHQAPAGTLHFSEFSLYSLGVILLRLKRYDIFLRALEDLFFSGVVGLIRLDISDMSRVANAAQAFFLDFDDAYQYVAAEKYGLSLLSFDQDFDRTTRGRKVLEEVLGEK